MLNPPSWHRIKEIVDGALRHTPEARDAFVLQTCSDDPSLRSEVESLLAAISNAANFIEQPAFELLPVSAPFPAGWVPAHGGRMLEPGNTLTHYKILEFVGSGGMGEVYRAHDENLNRDVALKVRPASFAPDPDRFARFRREAQMIAALNHPNVAAIYGLELSTGGMQALVLEFVDGVTLADRIRQGRVPVNEALSIAKQIAEGVEAAHKKGIIHSDLKPANIKLRPDGSVKILDFGLAKALDVVDASTTSAESHAAPKGGNTPTGLIFGTAAYMSPEQARGQLVDKRTDVWAFACVLYEMLAGHPAYGGKSIDEILAGVLNNEPDWSLLPDDTPLGIVKLLHKCLQKNADRRLHDIADARIEIEDENIPISPAVSQRRTRRPMIAFMASVAAIAVIFGTWSLLRSSRPPDVPAVKRLQIRLPDAVPGAWSMPVGSAQLLMAISPDGTRLAYVLQRQGVSRIYLHELDKLEPTPIPGTEGAFGPFFSPDGRWIGFFAESKLKKVAVSGGKPMDLAAAPNAWGGSWGTDGTILIAVDEGRRPTRVPENGGVAVPIVNKTLANYTRPDILPGGKSAIVTIPLLGVGVLSLETGAFRLLVAEAGGGRYMPGYLTFARAGMLLAVPIDLERLVVTGPETVLIDGVRTELEGAGAAPEPQSVFSRDGTLVYAEGGAPGKAARPVWVDRHGTVQPLGLPPRTYRAARLSPDGRFLALIIADPRSDVWVEDLENGTLTQRTFGAEPETLNWTPDSERITFGSRRNGKRAFWLPRDGNSEPEPFLTEDGQPAFGSFSPDGKLVVTMKGGPATGLDLWVLALKGPQIPQPFLSTRFTEAGGTFSPDGRWIAYASDESGQYEIYVRPYPGPGGKWRVSTKGGEHVSWSRNGKELFYRNGQKLMSVAVSLSPEFTAAPPHLLFEGPYTSIDASSDGQRFLALEPVEAQVAPLTHLNIVLNWFADVKQRIDSVSVHAPH